MHDLCRSKINVTGFVQGVGFRPFVYKLAQELGITGWVFNDLIGVEIEIQGLQHTLEIFLHKLKNELPSIAKIVTCAVSAIKPIENEARFIIKSQETKSTTTAIILPELATCNDCLQDIFNKNNRRYLYPFTNCTQCGPRYSIIKSLPYNRHNTSMGVFPMCKLCNTEYTDINCRRFHAQPNACWECGPSVTLLTKEKEIIAVKHDAIIAVANAIREGKILAIKGLGGFHLVVDARNFDVIAKLRQRKHRDAKPFALMFPDLDSIKQECIIEPQEEQILLSQQAPIVLLQKQNKNNIAANVAPNNPYHGVMLPYMPLQHILLRELNFPIVATSGNISGEPICSDINEALEKLTNVADLFLDHNREIINRVDDSVIRVVKKKKLFLRRARGYSPFYHNNSAFMTPILATGADLKNTFAIAQKGTVCLSQHFGDLEDFASFLAFQAGVCRLTEIYNFAPKVLACDLHPNYLSTKYAMNSNSKLLQIQHHHAHIAAVMLEHNLTGTVLGIAWDGSGFGIDNTVWGGEGMIASYTDFKRVTSFDVFPLPGGEQAIKDPRRIAIGMLTALSVDAGEFFKEFTKQELKNFIKMIDTKINTPMTSSVGRLFDGVAAILGLVNGNIAFEGQAAMAVEFLAMQSDSKERYKFSVINSKELSLISWKSIISQILIDIDKKEQLAVIAKKFHNTLVAIIIWQAQLFGVPKVPIILTGGCFQNKILLTMAIDGLREQNFTVYWPEEIPINDGGIAMGQIAIANAKQGTRG